MDVFVLGVFVLVHGFASAHVHVYGLLCSCMHEYFI